MAKRTVLMVLTKDILRPHLDGRVYKEAKSLVKNGFSVTVLCRVYSMEDIPMEEDYKGFRIVRHHCELPKIENKARINQLLQNFKNVKSMANKIIQMNPDIIHAHDLNALCECVLAKRKLGVPLIYDSHEDWPKLEQTKGNNLLYISALIYENFLLSHVKEVITVNQILANKFKTKKPTTILHNYPKANEFNPKPVLITELKEKFGLADKIVIEYHGVIGRVKGMDKIIDLAAKLVKKFKHIRFLIIGPDYEKFVKIVKDRQLDNYIIFTGPVDYDQIPSYIAISDISYLVLQPTTQYLVSTPTKLFEAMIIGKPVIANAEFPEVVRVMENVGKNQLGILVKFNSNEIIEALTKLITDRSLREKYGKNGRAKALKHYTWESQEKDLIDLYENI